MEYRACWQLLAPLYWLLDVSRGITYTVNG